MPAPMPTATAKDRLEYVIFVTLVSLLRVLPFRQRSALMAWIMSRVIAPWQATPNAFTKTST